MKTLPILFRDDMVRAILGDRKTETRRPVKWEVHSESDGSKRQIFTERDVDRINRLLQDRQRSPLDRVKTPSGRVGAQLWVRECWAYWPLVGEHDKKDGVTYRATDDEDWEFRLFNWSPSIHMPRWASRITLAVESVRIERVREITEDGAIAEGINCYPFYPDDGFPLCDGYTHLPDDGECILRPTAKEAYESLWQSFYPGSWDRNDWVWVCKFRRVP